MKLFNLDNALLGNDGETGISRHSGRDAGIQAKDGNMLIEPVLVSGEMLSPRFHVPMLDFGIPAEMMSLSKLLRKGIGTAWEQGSIMLILLSFLAFPALALEPIVKINPEQEQHIGIRTLAPEIISSIPLARAPARVSLPPQNEYVVSAAQAGLVNKVEVAIGVNIAKGQVLAQIQSPSLLTLQRGVLDAVTGYNLAKSKLNRDTTLLEEGIIARMRFHETQSDFERYATGLREAEQTLAAAGVSESDIEALKQTRKLNSFMNVRSPIDGVILERMVTAGQRVDLLSPLFRIGKLGELWLEIDMPQERMNELRVGDHVRIENTAYTARIANIGQSVNPGSQSALVRGIIEGKPTSIRPGQNVNVQLSHASTDRLFRLPLAALVNQEGKTYVFARTTGGFAAKPVEVASTEERNVIIHEGLQGGEQVVTQGIAALKAAWIGIGSDE
jgi:cobalt-zinc-cadmium efflux system membrane fusion protein